MSTPLVISSPKVITIDGPAGSGKGTISTKLAKKLGWQVLDSGLLYRGLALLCCWQVNSFKPNADKFELAYLDQPDLLEHCLALPGVVISTLIAHLQLRTKGHLIYLKDLKNQFQEITVVIKSENCGNLASQLAVSAEIRTGLLNKQRAFLQEPGLIADGRDMGTVVFPEANLKFFLDADPAVRAARRQMQLKELGVGDKLCNRIDGLNIRDKRDSARTVAPLQPAADAIQINTTNMAIEEVFFSIINKVKLLFEVNEL